MNKSKTLSIITMLTSFILMGHIIAQSAAAFSIESFLIDNITRWEKYGTEKLRHRGTIYTTYAYDSPDVKADYDTYVTEGILMWGSIISCVESNTSPEGTIEVSDEVSGSNAITNLNYNPANNHLTSWTITIYSQNFDNRAENKKHRTIAHEIGHVYGLGHVDDSNYNTQIMSPDPYTTKNVTSYDLAGMDVMTHEHMHNGSYSTILEQYSSYMHKARCTTCLAYHLAQCVYTDYHSGMRHYLVVDCPCGNQHTESWSCSGNPCVLPFQSLPGNETE